MGIDGAAYKGTLELSKRKGGGERGRAWGDLGYASS